MQELFNLLSKFDIKYQIIEHPPFFTVDDGLAWHNKIPGLHNKTLFLKDKKDRLYLVSIPFDLRADLVAIEKDIGAARLSFARPDLLQSVLRLTPGAVTPFGLMFDQPPRVTAVLHPRIAAAGLVCFHPLRNDATLVLQSADLLKFLRATGHEPMILSQA